jgi:hypothetical protein
VDGRTEVVTRRPEEKDIKRRSPAAAGRYTSRARYKYLRVGDLRFISFLPMYCVSSCSYASDHVSPSHYVL